MVQNGPRSVFLIQTPQQHFNWSNWDLCINSWICLFSSFIRRCVTAGGYIATWRQTGVTFCQFTMSRPRMRNLILVQMTLQWEPSVLFSLLLPADKNRSGSRKRKRKKIVHRGIFAKSVKGQILAHYLNLNDVSLCGLHFTEFLLRSALIGRTKQEADLFITRG